MSEASPIRVYVDAWTLRQRFRELRMYERLLSGELYPVVDRDYAAPAGQRQPPGTRAQRVLYFEGNVQVAVVHQYVMPDGKLGASGLPDPKWLFDGMTILMLESPKGSTPRA